MVFPFVMEMLNIDRLDIIVPNQLTGPHNKVVSAPLFDGHPDLPQVHPNAKEVRQFAWSAPGEGQLASMLPSIWHHPLPIVGYPVAHPGQARAVFLLVKVAGLNLRRLPHCRQSMKGHSSCLVLYNVFDLHI
jgi:hypothetical protein